jgi:hypothetical protein
MLFHPRPQRAAIASAMIATLQGYDTSAIRTKQPQPKLLNPIKVERKHPKPIGKAIKRLHVAPMGDNPGVQQSGRAVVHAAKRSDAATQGGTTPNAAAIRTAEAIPSS